MSPPKMRVLSARSLRITQNHMRKKFLCKMRTLNRNRLRDRRSTMRLNLLPTQRLWKQRLLQCSRMNEGPSYYLSKLNRQNLTEFELEVNQGHCSAFGAGLAPVLVLCRAGISPASAPDLPWELSSLTPVLVLHKSQRTPLTLASGGHQAR